MERIRKYLHKHPATGHEVCYVVGLYMCSGKIKISEITRETDIMEREIICVYIENSKKESCIWKKILITLTNLIEMEYDWKEILGDD